MRRAVEPVGSADLAAWPTKRLLGLRDRLLRCEERVDRSDIQTAAELAALDPARIHFKSDPRWNELYEEVLAILSTREHVPGGDERAAQRKVRAQQARTHDRSRPASRGR